MTKLEHALALATKGFWLFPLKPNSKIPAHKGWKDEATRDRDKLAAWFGGDSAFNVGVSTSRFADNEHLLVVDVDTKAGKHGDAELFRLELEGFELPDTFTTRTPTNGFHLYFRVGDPVRQGTNVLGKGVDTRGFGGLCVGPGSVVKSGSYVRGNDAEVSLAPQWLIDRCGQHVRRDDRRTAVPPVPTPASAVSRARDYLANHAPLAIEGEGGDETTYKVAARLRDFGIDERGCCSLMLSSWNERCSPPWPPDELERKVKNAYEYGQNAQGADAPENQFEPVSADVEKPADSEKDWVHPNVEQFNKEYAFVLAGGGDHVLWETTDAKGQWSLVHLNTASFHRKFASVKSPGKRDAKATEAWMEWKGRRSYDGLVFMPQLKAPDRFYNLWRGFAVEPIDADETPSQKARDAVDAFLEHARTNVCGGDAGLFGWLMGYFGHIVQKPWEKPLVALVFRGPKGTGKNALIQHVGELLGGHFLLTSNRRYLVGNFNGHLENCLLFTLDEAFWSGDKQAEGTLKDLITGKSHVIEHKGKETYTVDNRTRIAIIGNEDWVVPASYDERRFAVFEVGTGRQKDIPFFRAMAEGMRDGGNRLLLRHLLNVDLTGIDVNDAPATAALHEQKKASLDPFQQWWLSCLYEGRITAGDFGEVWPQEIEKARFRQAFFRWAREHNVKARLPSEQGIGRMLNDVAKGTVKEGRTAGGYTYRMLSLAEVREAWERHIGHTETWPE